MQRMVSCENGFAYSRPTCLLTGWHLRERVPAQSSRTSLPDSDTLRSKIAEKTEARSAAPLILLRQVGVTWELRGSTSVPLPH